MPDRVLFTPISRNSGKFSTIGRSLKDSMLHLEHETSSPDHNHSPNNSFFSGLFGQFGNSTCTQKRFLKSTALLRLARYKKLLYFMKKNEDRKPRDTLALRSLGERGKKEWFLPEMPDRVLFTPISRNSGKFSTIGRSLKDSMLHSEHETSSPDHNHSSPNNSFFSELFGQFVNSTCTQKRFIKKHSIFSPDLIQETTL